MTSLKLNKRGLLKGIFSLVFVLMIFGLISIGAYLLFSNMKTGYDNAGLTSSEAGNRAITGFDNAFKSLDYLIVIFMISGIIGLGLLSYKLAAPKVFFVLIWLFAPILGAISWFFNFIFISFIGQAVFNAVIGTFPITMLLCTNLHWVALIGIAVGSITFYSKKDTGQIV